MNNYYLYEQIKVSLCSTKPRTFQPNKLLINSILENLLLDLMFDLPTIKNLSEVIINEQVVNGESDPILVYSEENQKESAS